MTGCRVSLNEVLRLSRRVFLALGAGPGCEYEPARGVAWLASRGLPGLEMLLQDCQAVRRTAPAMMRETGEGTVPTLRIDGDGASGAWIAAATADWLIASGPQCTARVDAVRSALWFIPDLAARGGHRPGWMMARDPGNELMLAGHWDEAGPSLQFWCDPQELAGRNATVTLGCGSLPAHGHVPRLRLSPQELHARHEASLAGGIHVDETLWLSLYQLARGALVPETEESRTRGAGAQGH